MNKIALVTGITGQDGAYLAELLLEKGYIVHGLKRRSSLFNTQRIDHLFQDFHEKNVKMRLHYSDLTDSTNLIRIIQDVQPDEIYNLAALVPVLAREYRHKEALAPVAGRYDYVFIDCPPSLGLLTVNALAAAAAVLVPLQCEYFALEGVSELVSTVRRIQKALNPGLEIEGVLLTMADDRTNLAQQVMAEIREHFKDKVFRTVIPRSVRLAEAPSFGKPILLYDIRSRGAEAYLDLAKEVMAHEKKGAGQGALRAPAGICPSDAHHMAGG